jgi:hypothetical protein
MTYRKPPQSERPSAEPEIIPPDRDYLPKASGNGRLWLSYGSHHRIYMARPSPLAAILAAVVLGGFALGVFALVVGAILIALPLIGLLSASLLLAWLLREQVIRRR